MMDVTGNNIANVNTAGYKSRPRVFEDTLSQMMRAAGAPAGRHRRHEPGPGRPRRAARRHRHQLQPGLGADHRPRDRPDDPGRRLLRRQARAARSCTPAPARSTSTPTAGWSPRRRARAGLDGRQRRGRHQRARRRHPAADRHAARADGDRQRRRRGQPGRPTPPPAPTISTRSRCTTRRATRTTWSTRSRRRVDRHGHGGRLIDDWDVSVDRRHRDHHARREPQLAFDRRPAR